MTALPVGLKFWFASLEELSSVVMLSSAGFLFLSSFLLLSPFSGSYFTEGFGWEKGKAGQCSFYLEREKASVFSARRILHYALQAKRYSAM